MGKKEEAKEEKNFDEMGDFREAGHSSPSADPAADAALAPSAKGAEEGEAKGEKGKDAKSVMTALKEITADEEDEPQSHASVTLSSILGGDILGGKWFRRQVWYILFVTVLIVVYVSNRYACQQEMVLTKQLTDTLMDRRYKALTRSSQLKEKMRRSNIEKSLPDSALQTTKTPMFNLPVSE